MIKAQMLVPIRDNDGRGFRRQQWHDLQRRLEDLGGFSLLPGVVTGGWVNDGRRYSDQSRQYVSVLQSWFDLAPWLEVVLWARDAFQQEAIYIEVAGVPEIVGPR